MLRLILIIFFYLLLFDLNAQFLDNFNDGDFRSNPGWEGDLSDFIINDKYQLQLDASESGTSRLYSKYNSFDSTEWNFYIKMDFNPSNSNKLRIFFMLDNIHVDSANGYFVEIGENGSGDKIKLYGLEKGERRLLAEGAEGEFSLGPVETNIRIQRFNDGILMLDVKKPDQYYKNEFEIFSDIFIKDSAFFMLECNYTSTRKNKFYFDDISIKEYEKDLSPPNIIKSEVLSDNNVLLKFDEPLQKESVNILENYLIINNLKNPVKIRFNDTIPNLVELEFDFNFESGEIYTLEIKGLKDLKGNLISQNQFTYFYITEPPDPGDLIINEVLFNPFSGGSDFVELINISSKFIDLNGLIFKNCFKDNSEKIFEQNITLNPGKYLCITRDISDILRDYFVPDTAFVLQNDLPSFDDDTGNVSIISFDKETAHYHTIDSFDYSKNMHSGFINDVEGLSLERKNPLGNTNDKFNWNSAATYIGGATPGYKNSVFYEYNQNISDNFLISNNIFSPDFDGIDDNLIIEYSFQNPQNLTNIYIFDSKGRYLTKLLNNEMLGTKGIITWDGYVDMKKMPVGVYILFIETLDISGIKKNYKKTCILAQNLN